MKRYRQQIVLPEIGTAGQAQISTASILVVGAGGLGSIVTGYLAAMGVGNIGICDGDIIEESNLHRQFFYTPDVIGKSKAKVLAQKLQVQNPHISITPIEERFTVLNANELSKQYQIMCDCTDNVEARLLLNECCGNYSIPLVHGAVSEWNGYVTVFHYREKFSYADLFESQDLLNSQSCSVAGINSAICGIIGSYMVNETLKILLKSDAVLEGKLFYMNGLNNLTRCLTLKRKPLA